MQSAAALVALAREFEARRARCKIARPVVVGRRYALGHRVSRGCYRGVRYNPECQR